MTRLPTLPAAKDNEGKGGLGNDTIFRRIYVKLWNWSGAN